MMNSILYTYLPIYREILISVLIYTDRADEDLGLT